MASSRPSTSGGPSTRLGGTTTFDKRMSRDDSFLTSSTRRNNRGRLMPANNRVSRDDSYIRDRMASMSQFHIPVAGPNLTPTNSPPHQDMQEAWVPVRRMDTPESMTSGEIPIGMALGSPAHVQPDTSRWQAQFPPASPATANSSSVPSPMNAPTGSLQRKKTGRQKLFGLFGGGKKHAAEEAKGGLSIMTKGSVGSTSTLTSMVAPKTPKTPTRSNTQTDTRTPRHKPLMSRANTMPQNIMEEPMPNGLNFSSSTDAYLRQRNENQKRAVPIPPIPRLDVRIPDTKMERYSVMFSDVLKGSGSVKQQEPAASLLARRQATLERLKTINGSNGGYTLAPVQEDDRARPRRATSPMTESHPQPAPVYAVAQPASSTPRLSVFPAPPSVRTGATTGTPSSQSSRMARSNTSPGRLPSPTHGAFDKRPTAPLSRGASKLEVPSPFEMNPPDHLSRPSRAQEPIYPTDTSFHFGPEQSALVLDSPVSIDSATEEEDIVISQPFRPTLHEPQWQLVSPANGGTSAKAHGPASSLSSATTLASQSRGRSPSAASSSTHMTKPSSELDPSDAALANAVEVSIARQISISRQQRNLLRPLNTARRSPAETKTTTMTRPGGVGMSVVGEGRSPLGVTVLKAPSPSRLGKDEPIKETKTSTPTLVQRRTSPVDPQNRKSSWVVLESD